MSSSQAADAVCRMRRQQHVQPREVSEDVRGLPLQALGSEEKLPDVHVRSRSKKVARQETAMPSRKAKESLLRLRGECLLSSFEAKASLQRMWGEQSVPSWSGEERLQTVSCGRSANAEDL